MIEIYKNEEWLKEKYLEDKISTIQIGKLCGETKHTIRYWLKKYDINRRNINERRDILYKKYSLYGDKDWLYTKYIKEKLSIPTIAKLCNVDSLTIFRWLKRYNIPRRSNMEAQRLALSNHCNLSKEAIEWINGEMLGDGHIHKSSLYSANFQYSSKHKEYVQYISDTLKSFGIGQVGKIRKRKLYYKDTEYYAYVYNSRAYPELMTIRKQWYPEGKKIVPKDIELTSLTCRQWYIGDGCLLHKRQERPYIILSTCGFKITDVNWLIDKLSIFFNVTRQAYDNVICVSVKSVKDFLEYIGNCPVKFYQYKWAY